MTLRKAGKNDSIDGIMVTKGTILYIPVSRLDFRLAVVADGTLL